MAGFWTFDQLILEILKMNASQFNQTMPKCISSLQNVSQEDKTNMWMTVLVYVWLNQTKKAQKMSWKLMGMKALSWMRKQGFDVKQAQQEAGALVK